MDPQLKSSRACSICHRTFKRTEHCLRHERAHANVKPYNCSFCERSYGRKDLVVRHEKTLHPEEWNRAQREKRSGKGLSSAPPPPLPTPTGNDWNSSSHVSYPSTSRLSQDCDMQSSPDLLMASPAGFLPSPQGSDQDRRTSIAYPVTTNIKNESAYPLTPGSYEQVDMSAHQQQHMEAEYSAQSLQPGMYQFAHQQQHQQYETPYAYQFPAGSGGSSNELPSIPIDPKLSDDTGVATGNRLPAQSPASAINYLELFSFWHGRNLDARSGRSQPGTDTGRVVTFDDVSYRRLLDDIDNRLQIQKNSDKAHTPDIDCLQKYLDAFFAHSNHSHLSIIHAPSFHIGSAPGSVILAMCSIGAIYSGNKEEGTRLRELGRRCLDLSSSRRSTAGVQCILLLGFAGLFAGDPSLAASVVDDIGILRREFSTRRLLLSSQRPAHENMSWEEWIGFESSKRLLCGMVVLSSLLTASFDIPPFISLSQDLELELPCHDSVWQGHTDVDWRALRALHPPSGITIREALTRICSGNDSGIDGASGNGGGISEFSDTAKTILIHAANISVWTTIQSSTCLPIQHHHRPSAGRQADTHLVGRGRQILMDCYKLITSNYSHAEGSSQSSSSAISTSASIAILRSALTRTFLDNDPFDRAVLLDTNNEVIHSSCMHYASAPFSRTEDLIKVAGEMLSKLMIPLYERRGSKEEGGSYLVSSGVEHSISIFDCALLFTKLIHAIEIHARCTQLLFHEQHVLDRLHEFLQGVESQGANPGFSSLAARAARVWSFFLHSDKESKAGGNRRAVVLNVLADAFEKNMQMQMAPAS